jgi:hypothetical protein
MRHSASALFLSDVFAHGKVTAGVLHCVVRYHVPWGRELADALIGTARVSLT